MTNLLREVFDFVFRIVQEADEKEKAEKAEQKQESRAEKEEESKAPAEQERHKADEIEEGAGCEKLLR